jgi:hypothetical protein
MIMMGTCITSDPATGRMLVNIRSYFQDGSFNGSMRYTVKNASTGATAVAAYFAMNDIGDSVRMVTRGSGNTKGPASIISANARGPIIFANNRKKPILWDLDMTDTGDEFTHLNWPMMALVPQSGVASNAFFGIGTTNPLAMLHVAGSGLIQGNLNASNGFRLANGVYGNTEWITYADTTNLNQGLQAQIDTTTNRVKSIENSTSLWNQASIDSTNAWLNRVSGMEGRTSVWNIASLTSIDATNRIAAMESKTSTWNTASSTSINATNRILAIENKTGTWNQAVIDSTNAWINRMSGVEGRTGAWNTASLNAIDATNRIANIEVKTSVWNQASVVAISATNQIAYYHTAKRFKANIGNANITYATGPAVIPYTNVVLAASGGSIYSNGLTVCQWWPKATNGVVKLNGSWNAASANSATYKIHVYKNGVLYADVYSWLCVINLGNNSMGSTWSFIDTATPTLNDYYQIENTFNSTRASLGTGTNNWWYGEVTSY